MIDLLVASPYSPVELLLMMLAVPGLLLCLSIFFTAYMAWRARAEDARPHDLVG